MVNGSTDALTGRRFPSSEGSAGDFQARRVSCRFPQDSRLVSIKYPINQRLIIYLKSAPQATWNARALVTLRQCPCRVPSDGHVTCRHEHPSRSVRVLCSLLAHCSLSIQNNGFLSASREDVCSGYPGTGTGTMLHRHTSSRVIHRSLPANATQLVHYLHHVLFRPPASRRRTSLICEGGATAFLFVTDS